MLKKRLIPVIYIKNGLIVRSELFAEHKIIGNVVNEVQRYNEWDIDELVYIDISRERIYDSRRDDHRVRRINSISDALELISKECFMPLTFGGGIRNYSTIKDYLKNGADKVIINTMLYENKNDVELAVSHFGSQAIVASLDYRNENGKIVFYSNFGTKRLPHSPIEMAYYVQTLGCGEVFATSIDRDGTGEGYDINSTQTLVDIFDIPVIACGGAMSSYDFIELAKIDNISGIAAGNMFHFTENVYPKSKKILKSKGLNFR